MITSMMGRMADAEKLSIPQLQQAIKNGTIPAYVGVPMLQDKMRQHQQAMAAQQAQQGQQAQQQQRPIADEVMDEAYNTHGGVDQLPSNLSIMDEEEQRQGQEGYAGGGIIAFSNPTEENNYSRVTDPDKEEPGFFSSLWGDIKGGVKAATDPAYRAFVEDGGYKGDISIDAYRALGNDVEPPKPTPTPSAQTLEDRKNFGLGVESLGAAAKDIFTLPGRAMGSVNDFKNRLLRVGGVDAPEIPANQRFGADSPGLTPYMDQLQRERAIPQQAQAQDIENGLSQQKTPTPTAMGNYDISAQEGVASLPAAKNVQTKPGAPAPAQAGGTGTGAGTASSPIAGAPATLKEAEKEKTTSEPAAAAVSMVDEYVKQLRKSGEDVSRDKKEALYMTMISGGLAIAGGTSPNALANISAGAQPAIQQYQKTMGELRKDERERLEKLLNAGLKKEEILLKAKEIGINETKAANWLKIMEDKNNIERGKIGAGEGKLSLLEQKQLEGHELKARQDVARAQRDMDKALSSDEMYKINAQIASTSKDPKKRADAQAYVDNKKQPFLDNIADARAYANIYANRRNEAYGGGVNGGTTLPAGIPVGSRLAGKSGGKDVYAAPDGKKYIVD